MPDVVRVLVPPYTVAKVHAGTSTVIRVFGGTQGDKGDKGDKGDDGTGGGAPIVFDFDVPSTGWVVSHGLDAFPAVTVVDNELREMLADVQYVDENTITVTLANPQAGKVYLSL